MCQFGIHGNPEMHKKWNTMDQQIKGTRLSFIGADLCVCVCVCVLCTRHEVWGRMCVCTGVRTGVSTCT